MKKSICFLIPSHFSANFGGAEYQVKLILNAFSQNSNFNIYCLCKYVGTNYSHKGYHIRKIGYGTSGSGFGRFGLVSDFPSLYRALKKIEPQIIYQRIGCAYTGIAALYAKKHNKKMIWHISSENNVKPFKFNFEKRIIFDYIDKKLTEYGIRNCWKIIGQTEDQNKLLTKHYARRCDAIIPNFHPYIACEIQKEKPLKILWVANFKEMKRPEIFVEVAKHFEQRDDVQFYMIGRGQDRKNQTRIEEEIANINNLKYLGEKKIEEVNDLFCQAHIFINTSDFEGFPNTFIQAWMRKVPVVSLNVDPDDILKNEGIGFHSGSFEQLVKDTKRLMEDEELREAMGEKAQCYAFKNHSLANIEKIVELIVE